MDMVPWKNPFRRKPHVLKETHPATAKKLSPAQLAARKKWLVRGGAAIIGAAIGVSGGMERARMQSPRPIAFNAIARERFDSVRARELLSPHHRLFPKSRASVREINRMQKELSRVGEKHALSARTLLTLVELYQSTREMISPHMLLLQLQNGIRLSDTVKSPAEAARYPHPEKEVVGKKEEFYKNEKVREAFIDNFPDAFRAFEVLSEIRDAQGNEIGKQAILDLLENW